MEETAVVECLKQINTALLGLEDAKSDADFKIKGAISAYGFSNKQGKELLRVAKEVVKGNAIPLKKQADDISAIAEIAIGAGM